MCLSKKFLRRKTKILLQKLPDMERCEPTIFLYQKSFKRKNNTKSNACGNYFLQNEILNLSQGFLIFSYVVPVLLMALILNVPKFLEAQFTWTPIDVNGTILNDSQLATLNDSQVEYQIGYQTTELRDDPNYIQFYINWTRLITTGLIPMGALIYFNFGIFRGIQVYFIKNVQK